MDIEITLEMICRYTCKDIYTFVLKKTEVFEAEKSNKNYVFEFK